MAARSSTFSSERSFPSSGFPFAVVLAVVLVAAVEVAVRLTPAPARLGYGGGLPAYYEALHTLEDLGAADVVVLGSSRGREAIAAPDLAAELRDALHREVTIGNYSCPDTNPDANLRIVRKMLSARARPDVVVFFLSPQLLRATADYRPQVREIFGEFPDRMGRRTATWLASLTERPLWNLKRFLWRHYATFRYRFRFRNAATAALQGRRPVSAMQGSYTSWHLYTPDRSLETNPPTKEQLRIYVEQLLDEDGQLEISEGYLQDVRDAVRLCREAGALVVLVEEPLSDALTNAFPDGVLRRYHERLAELSKDTGVPVLGLSDLGVTLQDADFREQSHVNLSGARKFTAGLAARELIPALAGDSQAEVHTK